MMRRTAVVVASLSLAACVGADENRDGVADGLRGVDTVSQVAPSSPTGTLSGQVLNFRQQPVAEADVVFNIGGKGDSSATTFTTRTDMAGFFSLRALPAGGTGQLTVSRTGLSTFRGSYSIPGTAGNLPLNEGNVNVGVVLLSELAATVRFTVVTSAGPARGAPATLDVTPVAFSTTTGGFSSGAGLLTVASQVDDTGVLSFSGVPAPADLARGFGTYRLIIPAWDRDGDGRVDVLGTVLSFSAENLASNPLRTVTLSDAREQTGFTLLSSNVESLVTASNPLRNMLEGAEPITLVFSHQLQPAAFSARLTREDCATAVSSVRVDVSGNLATITPTTPWEVGAEYNLAIRAVSLESSSAVPVYTSVGYFFGGNPGQPRAPSPTLSFRLRKASGNVNNTRFEPGDTIFAVFDTPVRHPSFFFQGGAINLDLNNNGSIGSNLSDVCEVGVPFSRSCSLTADEPTSDPSGNGSFNCAASGYTTRWRFTGFANPAGGIGLSTALRVSVPTAGSATGGLLSIWGQPLTGDFNGVLGLPMP